MFGLIAGIASGVGSLIGARQRKKQAARDAARALQLAREDERRLKDATGYDFEKLRDQAVAAGFNPLTVLQATGGQGYDGRGAIVTSPFVPQAQYAGYIGDAIGAGLQTYLDVRQQDRMFKLDAQRNDLLSRELDAVGRGFGAKAFGGSVRTGTSSDRFVTGDVFGPPAPINRRGTDLYSLGVPVGIDRTTSSAQDYSDHYGDFVGDIYGARNWAWDTWAELKREWNATPIMTDPGRFNPFAGRKGPPLTWSEDFGM